MNWKQHPIGMAKRVAASKVITRRKPCKNNSRTGGRPTSNSVVIQITTTPALLAVLDKVVGTGFFGTSRAAAAERLLAEALRGLLREGTIARSQKVLDD